MKCPKYIQEALVRRAACAERFTDYDITIRRWLEKHDIIVEDFDICGGCESYVNPYASSGRIYKAILEKGNEDDSGE
jgi:hypothetical protein